MTTRTRLHQAVIATALSIGCIAAAHAEGFYGGVSVGTPNYKSGFDGISGTGSGLGGKVYLGYDIAPNFAIEGGYFELGHISNATGRVNTRGVFVDGVGKYALAPQWMLMGRLGVAQGRFTTTNGNDTSPAMRLGAGVEYALNTRIGLRAEYAHYRFSSAFDTKTSVGEFTLGVRVGF